MQFDSSFTFLPANSCFIFILFSHAQKIGETEVRAIERPEYYVDLTRATDTWTYLEVLTHILKCSNLFSRKQITVLIVTDNVMFVYWLQQALEWWNV